jgi:hypothetical protein
MAVTGPGIFDSDEAASFAAELAAEPSVAALDAALTAATLPVRLDLYNGARALVAAEAVAAGLGRPSSSTPTRLRIWAENTGAGIDDRRSHALAALNAVKSDDSELCELASAHSGWTDAIAELQGRLL